MKDILGEKRNFQFWRENSNSLIPYEGNKFHFLKIDHVTPPTGIDESWNFRHHFEASNRWKRIFDFGGKIPTR